MVKNTSGGKYAKKAKRGSLNPPLQRKTRVVEEEGELYACIKRILGNGRIEVMCIDNVLRQCHIPKKFRYFKRDNIFRVNSWVMVGIRLWESNKNNCDLLEVYSEYDVEYLKKLNENWFVFGEEESDLFNTDEIDISEHVQGESMHSSNAEEIDLADI
jgi:initiation factor 1A